MNLGYLHFLYRNVIRTKGPKAIWKELAEVINLKSDTPAETRPSIDLSSKQVNKWFNENGGKEISAKEKPLDSEEHCILRREWVIKYYGILTCLFTAVAFIDEKWFYRTNRRRKIKILELGEHETEGDDTVVRPKMLSRRFPVKSMFMGVVGRPVPHRNFDGRIFLERVSKRKYIQTCTSHTNFSDDALINGEIKKGKWRDLISDLHLTVLDIKQLFF